MKKALLATTIIGSMVFGTVALAAPSGPSLSVSGGSTPYAPITVSGTGFQAGETVHVMLGLNSTDVVANSQGGISNAALTIPNFPAGLYLVIAIGQSSGLPVFTYLYVNALFPQASPSSWYATPGSPLTWSGSGFAPNEQVTIALSGSTTATFMADANGSFTGVGSSVVPFALQNSNGVYTLTGAKSGVSKSFTVGVAGLYPYVSPSTWYTQPGVPVTFTGAGFGANEGVSVYLGSSTVVLAHGTADAAGSFMTIGPATIPYTSGSVANFRLVGDLSGAVASAPITLAPFYPQLTPSSYYAAPGSFLSLSGSGFVPNESVTVTVGTAAPVQATTSGMGVFTLPSIHIPTTPNTTLTISAVGITSGASSHFDMAVGGYYSWMTLSTYWAQGGSALTVLGHNFAAGETVSITSGTQTLGSAVADNTGDFTAAVAVPYQKTGPATITSTGALSGASANNVMTVSPVYTDFQLGSYAGAPGTAVSFVGHGYLPNETVTITTDRTGATAVATFTANATGDFTNSSFVIPAGFVEGNLALTATTNHSFDTKTITFYVTSN